MSKKVKIIIIIASIVLALFLLAVFVIRPLYFFYTTGHNIYDTDPTPEIAEKYDYVDYNEASGEVYINDEILVIAYTTADRADIEAVADRYDAVIVGEMEDIGFYKFRFPKAMSYRKIKDLAEQISFESAVEYAYPSTLFEVESDDFDPEENRSPSYPQDTWNNASWNVDVPRGDNWGAEAIRAPQAWAYSDEFSHVNVGLIDTMITPTHPDLRGSTALLTATENGVTTTYDITSTGTLKPDSVHHGSHVAGIMAANWDSKSTSDKTDTTGIAGIAGPNVSVFYAHACYTRNNVIGGYDYYDAFNFLQAIDTLTSRNVKVINISLNTSRLKGYAASRGNKNAISSLTTEAQIASIGLQRMLDTGDDMVICVAAGNNNKLKYYKDDSQPYGYRDYSIWWKFWEIAEYGDAYAQYNNFLCLIENKDVKDIIVTVGAVGIDEKKSTDSETRYKYSNFSNIGPRVDVSAPGENIYSCFETGYVSYDGTSMATPHVTGVASMVYAANPDLTGAEVKRILLASTYGRYYYTDGYSGIIDAEKAVKFALESRDKSVAAVVKDKASSGLDLCFVVDTTGSMGDDIGNAKDNMESILEEISAKNPDFRVALIDYRDYSERTYNSYDYPCKVQLDFSDDMEEITTAINSLDLGNGGDNEETVYSALMETIELDWRDQASKIIILLGDAAPLDPEPYTGYTLGSVILSLYNADIVISDESDDRVLGNSEDSLIKVFSIGTDASYDAADMFSEISDATGGVYTGVGNSSEVSDAIISSIEQIEIIPLMDVSLGMGDSLSSETVEIFRDGDFLFEVKLDEYGDFYLDDMEIGTYEWSAPRVAASGTFTVKEDSRRAVVHQSRQSLGDMLIMFYMRNTAVIWLFIIFIPTAAVLAVFAVKTVRKAMAAQPEKVSPAAPVQPPVQTAAQNPVQPPVQNPAPAGQFKFCRVCGMKLPMEAGFCPKCGSRQ